MQPLQLPDQTASAFTLDRDRPSSSSLSEGVRAYLRLLRLAFLPWIALHFLMVYSFHYGSPDMTYRQVFVLTSGLTSTYWLLTPALIMLSAWAAKQGHYRAALIHIAGAIAFSLLHPVIRILVHLGIGTIIKVRPIYFHNAMWLNLFTNATLYVAMAGGATAYVYFSEARRRAVGQAALRAELAESRLRMLRAQIHPHFLFNTLHDISGLLTTDRNAASAMMGRLEELLRIAVKDQADDLVPLAQELRFLQCYLDIEKMRLGERLTVHLEIGPGTLSALVPSMVLQPLVENSVKHGIAKFSRRGWLRIAVRRDATMLQLVVEDSGPGIRGASKTGVGLSNTEARLSHYYSTRQSIRYTNLPGQGLRCEINIPFTESAPAAVESAPVPEFAL